MLAEWHAASRLSEVQRVPVFFVFLGVLIFVSPVLQICVDMFLIFLLKFNLNNLVKHANLDLKTWVLPSSSSWYQHPHHHLCGSKVCDGHCVLAASYSESDSCSTAKPHRFQELLCP